MYVAPFQDRALQVGIADCYEQGLVRAIGVSNYGPKQLKRFHAYLEARGIPLATAQVGSQEMLVLMSCHTHTGEDERERLCHRGESSWQLKWVNAITAVASVNMTAFATAGQPGF